MKWLERGGGIKEIYRYTDTVKYHDDVIIEKKFKKNARSFIRERYVKNKTNDVLGVFLIFLLYLWSLATEFIILNVICDKFFF